MQSTFRGPYLSNSYDINHGGSGKGPDYGNAIGASTQLLGLFSQLCPIKMQNALVPLANTTIDNDCDDDETQNAYKPPVTTTIDDDYDVDKLTLDDAEFPPCRSPVQGDLLHPDRC